MLEEWTNAISLLISTSEIHPRNVTQGKMNFITKRRNTECDPDLEQNQDQTNEASCCYPADLSQHSKGRAFCAVCWVIQRRQSAHLLQTVRCQREKSPEWAGPDEVYSFRLSTIISQWPEAQGNIALYKYTYRLYIVSLQDVRQWCSVSGIHAFV